MTVPVIHAVTTDDIVARSDFLTSAAGVMRVLGSRGAVHLRAPAASGRRLYALASELAGLQDTTGAWLVVNDRVDVAACTGSRAAQLTSRSLTVRDAAAAAMGAAAAPAHPLALGASVHTLDQARSAVAEGATRGPGRLAWLVVGHVFATASHPDAPERGAAFLARVASEVSVPVVAIGGIRPDHVRELLSVGTHGVAVIRGIWHAVDAERAAGDYLSAYDAVRDARAAGRGGSGDHS